MILTAATAIARAPASEPELLTELVAAQEASHQGDMGAADSLSRSLISRWPENPTGYYARAALVQIRTMGCQGVLLQKELRENLQKAVETGTERIRQHPEDTWARYILGLALGLEGVLAVREGSLWQAYRKATRSVDELEEVLRRDPSFADAWLPLGTYHFWRGEALKRWVWLPFISDTRAQGIAEMRRAAQEGRTTKVSAQSMLLWALLMTDQYEEALRISGPLVERYPANRSFLWARAEAFKALGRWREAEEAFAAVSRTFGPEYDGCPGPVEIRAKRGMALAELGECERARPLLEAALAYTPPPTDASNFAGIQAEARHYLERCAQVQAKRR